MGRKIPFREQGRSFVWDIASGAVNWVGNGFVTHASNLTDARRFANSAINRAERRTARTYRYSTTDG